MALFFSRRAYNKNTGKFTNRAASLTRYVMVQDNEAPEAGWSGGIISQSDWLDQVRVAGGAQDVLVFVHGFNMAQSETLTRLAKIETGLRAQGYQGAVVAFDWPSDGSVLRYNADKSDAKRAAKALVSDGVAPLLGMPSRPKVHFLAHSMGAYVILRGLSDVGDSAGPGAWKIDQMCFASADADAAWLEKGAWGALVLNQRSRRFTNYYSGRDRVLALSDGLINGGRDRLGHVGMPTLQSNRHFDVYCNAQYLRHVPEEDQSMRYSHTWWFDDAGFYRDLALTLAGRDADDMPTRQVTDAPPDQALLTPLQ